MSTKVIEGRDFEFRYDPAKMRAFLEVVEEDLALLVLRFREEREPLVSEDIDEQPRAQNPRS
jgi:hypothetical protein